MRLSQCMCYDIFPIPIIAVLNVNILFCNMLKNSNVNGTSSFTWRFPHLRRVNSLWVDILCDGQNKCCNAVNSCVYRKVHRSLRWWIWKRRRSRKPRRWVLGMLGNPGQLQSLNCTCVNLVCILLDCWSVSNIPYSVILCHSCKSCLTHSSHCSCSAVFWCPSLSRKCMRLFLGWIRGKLQDLVSMPIRLKNSCMHISLWISLWLGLQKPLFTNLQSGNIYIEVFKGFFSLWFYSAFLVYRGRWSLDIDSKGATWALVIGIIC